MRQNNAAGNSIIDELRVFRRGSVHAICQNLVARQKSVFACNRSGSPRQSWFILGTVLRGFVWRLPPLVEVLADGLVIAESSQIRSRHAHRSENWTAFADFIFGRRVICVLC
jgi:hypothetical protein